MPLVLGIDLGTQGIRAVISDLSGNIIASSSNAMPSIKTGLPKGWHEQNPDIWWEITVDCLKKLLSQNNLKSGDIGALSIDSTSGTIIPVDENGNPLYPAIMYNDSRSSSQSDIVNNAAGEFLDKMGYRFNSSFALPKIFWIKENKPDIYSKTYKFLHAADFLAGKLTGNFSVSDTSNALKCGYDLIDMEWPKFIFDKLKILKDKLPEVYLSGKIIGEVSQNTAKDIGLKKGIKVAAGSTDGTASFFASGALKTGEWNSTLGTTLVIRGVSKKLIKDKLGRIYSHYHPEEYWLPGGASNTGGECLAIKFKGENFKEMDEKAKNYIPSDIFVYPLVRKGERLPFINNKAEGFISGNPKDKYELYLGYLEGVGYVEKWIYDIFKELKAGKIEKIYATGGGASSKIWLQIRANILNLPFNVPKTTEAAFGSAIIAASKTYFKNLSEAGKKMIQIDKIIEPQADLAKIYREKYLKFRKICREKFNS